MRQQTVRQGALLVVAGCLALACAARGNGGGEKGKAGMDARFVLQASATDLAEINLGKLAAERAESAEVKKFGERMIADHTKSSKELLAIISKKGLTPATKMDAKHEALERQLLALKGAEFDSAYMKHMVMGHKKAVALYQAEAKGGEDADLKAFAAKTLPVVQEHLRRAEKIHTKAKVGKSD